MLSIWTRHIKDPEEKVQFEKSLLHSKWILTRQREILDEMEKDLDRAELSPRVYETPNWDYRQAHNNGCRQYLQLIKDLITLDQKDKHEPRQSTRPTGGPAYNRPEQGLSN